MSVRSFFINYHHNYSARFTYQGFRSLTPRILCAIILFFLDVEKFKLRIRKSLRITDHCSRPVLNRQVPNPRWRFVIILTFRVLLVAGTTSPPHQFVPHERLFCSSAAFLIALAPVQGWRSLLAYFHGPNNFEGDIQPLIYRLPLASCSSRLQARLMAS